MALSRHAYLALSAVLASAVEVPPGLELAIPITAVVPEVKPYDCDAEADIWEWAWTPDWKAWCCAHESKGCPPTSTATTTTVTTTTVPTTSTITSTETTTETTSKTATQTYTQTLTTSIIVTQTPAPTTTQTNTRTKTRTMRPEALHSQQPTDAAPASDPVSSPSRPVKSAAQPAKGRTRATTKESKPTTTPSLSTPQPEEASSESDKAATSEPDDGCNSNCVILGESATCQSRISWVEAHQTQHESAPCPAAHVVVMSQCEACGKCLFKKVKCASSAGVSKSLGEHTFMYRKYLQEPSGAIDVAPARPRGLVWAVVSLGIVPLAVMGLVSHRRRRLVSDDWGVDAAALVPEE